LMFLTSKAMTGEQRRTDGDTLILVVLSQNTPRFWNLSIDFRCQTIVAWSQPFSLANSRVVWRGSAWIKAFRKSLSNSDGGLKHGVSLMSKLLEVRKSFLGCYFSNIVFSVDGTNVSGCLCSFGASIELVKKKVSEMFIFLNLTLHGFGPEYFVPLV
jgi:hypothetical protein